jgi:hypothetical protein
LTEIRRESQFGSNQTKMTGALHEELLAFMTTLDAGFTMAGGGSNR